METLKNFFHFVYDVQGLIQWGGLGLVCTIVFVETGLFMGFFLPGDSLLVTLGCLCAIVGDQLGYFIGFKTGQALYKREDSLFFKRKHLIRTHEFYEKYGTKTIILARFMPIVRTFAPVVAGIGTMKYWRFLCYDIFGGTLWITSMTLGGYFLASLVPHIDKKIHYVIAIVVFVSILPGIIGFMRERRRAANQPT
ncbi:MAG: VTT domain-containing protein [Elusimicrobia bacterium]|nr:VTT domain-containing protein [Elusimicrobiota bacterium]